MRNLKRALSLTLASVMLLGMMVLGSSAASFNDADDIENVTAATILQELGIMQGASGNFAPKETVTRGQMAIIICKMLYGERLSVSQFASTQQFDDVPANQYYTGYVNLAANLGIISGYGNGNFGPGDPITTAQAALMLTRALGYYQNNELAGQGWAANALTATTLATRLDIFNGLTLGINDPLSRDNVSAMTFNTLTRATPVQFNSVLGEYYTVGGGATSGVKYIDAYEFGDNTDGEYQLTLGYTIYGLYISSEPNDDFGRPAEEWSSENGGVIGTFNKEPIAVYTAKVSNGDLFNLIGSSNVSKLTSGGTNVTVTGGKDYTRDKLEVYVDGDDSVSQTPSDYFVRNSSAGNESGKGVVTEVYQDENNNVTLVYINTYVMQATDDYSSSKGSVDVSVLTQPDGETVSVNALNDDDFAQIVDFKEDDYILYTYSVETNEVQTVAKAELLTGKVSAYSNAVDKDPGEASGSVSIDGAKYDYAKWAPTDNENGCAVTYTVGVDASIVLDKYGYAIYVDNASMSVGNYVYVANFAKKGGVSNAVEAEAYFTSGRSETITVKSLSDENGDDLKDGVTESTPMDDNRGWYSYSRNSSGEYTLKKAETGAKLSGTEIRTDRTLISTGVRANNATLFVVKDKNDNITLYTGIANVPDITGLDNENSWYLLENDKNDKGNEPAAVVFVDASAPGASIKNSTNDLLFLVKAGTSYVDKEDNERVYPWTVLLNGKLEEIETKNGTWTKNTLYENYSIDSDGYYEADDGDKFVENSDQVKVDLTKKKISYSNGNLTIGSDVLVIGDTEIHVIMAPADETGEKLLSGTIMTDEKADYELMLNATARNVANKFNDSKYCVTGTYYAFYNDKDNKDLVDKLYIVVTSAYPASDVTPDAPPTPPATAIPDDKKDTATNINEVLNGTGNNFTVSAPGAIAGIEVPAEKKLTINGIEASKDGSITNNGTMELKGEIASAVTVTGDGDTTLNDTTVKANMTLTGVTGDVTLGDVAVTGATTIAVDDVKIEGTVNLGAEAILKIEGTVTLGDDADITATEGAKIVVVGDANVSALAGIDGLKFFNSDGEEIVIGTTRTITVSKLPAGDYVYNSELGGWKRTEKYVDPDTCTHESLTKTDATDSTCETQGNVDFWTCDACDKIFSDENGTTETTAAAVKKPLANHTLTKTDATDSTCETQGNIDYWTCSVCERIFSDANGTTETTADAVKEPLADHTQTFTYDADSDPHTHSAEACSVCNDSSTAVTSEACADEDGDGSCDKCREAISATE